MPARLVLAGLLALLLAAPLAAATVSGTLRAWHPLTLTFRGPASSETATPNPFTDFRLQVVFTGPSGQRYDVPGFYDGDGAGGASGDVWRVRFAPDAGGTWRWTASFRTGAQVAVSGDASAGAATAFDGESGVLTIAARDAAAPGFLGRGRLEYVGGHYLKCRDGGFFIKGGCDEPENLLAFADFDGTTAKHTYAAHVADWRSGDPTWNGGKGKGLIGALNFLASRGVNSIYFMPMNIGGDGKDCWPFISNTSRDRYDVSKLAQWDIVFAHAQRLGILLHCVLGEAEAANKKYLDNAALGPQRKLYHRELAARFGHHNAIQWNLCEEYNVDLVLSSTTVKSFAQHLQDVDPYDHPITVHNNNGTTNGVNNNDIWRTSSWGAFFGDNRISATSFQFIAHWSSTTYDDATERMRSESAAKGRKLPICFDEVYKASRSDNESLNSSWPYLTGHSLMRKAVIWPILLSGGQVEHILDGALGINDFRPFTALWDYTTHARRFVEGTPFNDMAPDDALMKGAATFSDPKGVVVTAQVLAKRGSVYAIWLPKASTTGNLDLAHTSGTFAQRWYDPRTGQFVGAARTLTAGGLAALGAPPSDPAQDWAVLVERGTTPANTAPTITAIPDQATTVGTATAALPFRIGDAETAAASLTVSASSANLALLPAAGIVLAGAGADRSIRCTPAAGATGTATVTVTVSDGALTATDSFTLTVSAGAPTSRALVPAADAHVRGGSHAGRNFGLVAVMECKRATSDEYTREIWLRFDTAPFAGEVGRAVLRVTGGLEYATPTTRRLAVHGSASLSWTETGLTFANRPAREAAASDLRDVGAVRGAWEWDVTAWVAARRAAGASQVTLVLVDTVADDNARALFDSREAGASGPVLVVEPALSGGG